MIRFTSRTFRGGGTEFADALVAAARPVIRAGAEACGRQAQLNILAHIASTTGKRKGKPRSEPLADTARYPYRVNTSTRGAQLNFSVDGSAAFKAKFGSLNYGSPSHTIAPRFKRALWNPADSFGPVRGAVTHPGTEGRRFYEDGIQEALDDFESFL